MAFQVLSLTGGGFLGYFSICFLEQIEQRTGAPAASCFDLIAGTSIGGIIALALAAEVPAASIRLAFEQHGPRVFSPRASSAYGMLRAKYSDEPLRLIVSELLGCRKIGDLLHPVTIPAVNMTKGGPQVFKTPHHERFSVDWKYDARDVAMATAAAPLFFPLAEIDEQLFADGGLFAGSPDLVGYHEATRWLGASQNEVRMLSVGTTNSTYSLSSKQRDFGALLWMKHMRIIAATLASQQQMVSHLMRHLLDDRYCRVDAIASSDQDREIGLDVATPTAMKTLRGMANVSAQSFFGEGICGTLLDHRSGAPHFYYGDNKA